MSIFKTSKTKTEDTITVTLETDVLNGAGRFMKKAFDKSREATTKAAPTVAKAASATKDASIKAASATKDITIKGVNVINIFSRSKEEQDELIAQYEEIIKPAFREKWEAMTRDERLTHMAQKKFFGKEDSK